jgi:hypothetical protein
MKPFAIGDRVVLISCSGSPGTVTGLNRNKVLVCFDDQPCVTWVLRPSSVQSVPTAQGGAAAR